jgi:hypothetical protein
MKHYFRLVVLFVVVAGLVIVFYAAKQAAAPESAIIAKERDRMMAGFDKARAGRDPLYAIEFEDKSAFIDYQLALALIRENEPDRAIAVLQKLIAQEEVSGGGGLRRYRSFQKEAGYYEVLAQAYELKQDAAAVQKAAETRTALLAKAEDAKRKERQEEGRWVGRSGD